MKEFCIKTEYVTTIKAKNKREALEKFREAVDDYVAGNFSDWVEDHTKIIEVNPLKKELTNMNSWRIS